MCVFVLFGIRKDFIVWIKYFDTRTSIVLVDKEFCLVLFVLRNLWRPSFDGDVLYTYICEVFYDAVSSSGVTVRVQE